MVNSPQPAVAGIPLLATKLYIPKPRDGRVSRPRLTQRLDDGLERKLTLVSAPAGFGKTTLLAEWLASSRAGGRPVAWVSLDPGDNDPTRFWRYCIAALQTILPGAGANALTLLESSQPPPIEPVVTILINDLTTIENDFTLVLDDVHVIDAQPVRGAIAFLVDHMPPRMHLVLASRADPPLPLAHLRARGESIELRAADLRFTPDEAAAFLTDVMGLSLPAGDVAALETRTEGWIAGLQLAALSMQGRDDIAGFIAAFTGDDRYIVDYLVEEVLRRQPEPVRSFLLQTSILDRLSASLCDAITGRNDGKALLESLERANLFVVPLDDRRQWWRYHQLFADVLRAHAMEEQPDRLPSLHRRASQWHEQHGLPADAIEHARAAGDHDAVARLLVANVEQFARLGRNASIARWASSLPDAMVKTSPRLALLLAASALATGSDLQAARTYTSWAQEAIDLIEARGGLDPADDRHETVIGAEGLDALKGELLALKLAHSARNLPREEVSAMASQALSLLLPSQHRVRGLLRIMEADLRTTDRDVTSSLPSLESNVDEARRARNPTLLAEALTRLGLVYVATGRLDDGRRAYEDAVMAGQDASAEAALVMCGPHTGLAKLMLERGDLAGAVDHVAAALEFAGKSPVRGPVLFAHATAAQVLLAAGDIAAAFEQLAEAQRFAWGVRQFRFSSYLAGATLTFHCRTGDLEAAADVVRERKLSPDAAADHHNGGEMTAYARYLIARGDPGDAVPVLACVLSVVRERGQVHHEIRALVLQALAYELAGERPRALETLGRATMLGEPGRFNRSFTGEGSVLTGLVETTWNAVRRGHGPAQAGSASYLAWLMHEASARSDVPSAQPATQALAEPLSAREIEVWRLDAAGLSNREISERLFLALDTVKGHNRKIFAKLGVQRRTEAIARARELGLL
jgi:LuxR family maltose regulon positive regulatory protein